MLLGTVACAPAYPPEKVPFLPDRAAAPALFRAGIEPEYQIQIGDGLEIQSYYDSTLRQTVTVRPDGRISLVLLGDIDVAGKTAHQLDDELSKKYAERLPAHPDVTVTIQQMAEQVVYIGGEVKSPTIEPIKGSLTLLQGITEAGGFLPTANDSQVIVLRQQGQGEFRAYQIDPSRVLTNESGELYLKPHDIVFVPKTQIAKIDQYVQQYVNEIIPQAIRGNFGYEFVNQSGLGSSSTVHVVQ